MAGMAILNYGMTSIWQSYSVFQQASAASKQQVQERFIVPDVWFDESDQVRVYIYNYGGVSIKVLSVEFNQTAFENLDYRIDPGERIWLNFTLSWSPGIYEVRIFTEGGNVHVEYFET